MRLKTKFSVYLPKRILPTILLKKLSQLFEETGQKEWFQEINGKGLCTQKHNKE